MNPPPSTAPSPRLSGVVLWQLVAICLLILGAKLWLIGAFSSPLPFLDQWKGEGAQVLSPWLKGELHPADLLAPFNEHRILPTRLLVLALFEANARQWDAQVQMVAGAAIHAACAFLLGALLLGRLGSRRKWAVFAALLAFFGLPYDWQNTLWGFQSQFYFLILFTLLTLWGLGSHRAGSVRWWLGTAAGLLACVSMGSGGFAGLALAGWIGVKLLVDPAARRERGNWLTLAVAVALGGLALALYTPPTHTSLHSLQAPTLGGFLARIGLHLGWPNGGSSLFALPAFAPIVLLLGIHLRRKNSPVVRNNSLEELLFPLAFWVLLQAAALAYCRNAPASGIISRYMDLLALGALVNFAALLRFIEITASLRPALRRLALAALTGWIALAAAGLTTLTQRNVRLDLPSLQKIQRLQATGIRQFLLSNDPDALGGKPVFGLAPEEFPIFIALLRDPAIREILPTGVGVRLRPAPPGPLSATAQTLAASWGLSVGAGLLIFLLIGVHRALAARRTAQLPALETAICRIPS